MIIAITPYEYRIDCQRIKQNPHADLLLLSRLVDYMNDLANLESDFYFRVKGELYHKSKGALQIIKAISLNVKGDFVVLGHSPSFSMNASLMTLPEFTLIDSSLPKNKMMIVNKKNWNELINRYFRLYLAEKGAINQSDKLPVRLKQDLKSNLLGIHNVFSNIVSFTTYNPFQGAAQSCFSVPKGEFMNERCLHPLDRPVKYWFEIVNPK